MSDPVEVNWTEYQGGPNEAPIYPNSLVTVGIGHLQDDSEVVLMRMTMGERRFEFRFTAETARELGETCISRANMLEERLRTKH